MHLTFVDTASRILCYTLGERDLVYRLSHCKQGKAQSGLNHWLTKHPNSCRHCCGFLVCFSRQYQQ